MRKDKGITLVSLVVYVIVLIIVVTVMTTIINNFYKNTEALQGNVEEVLEFNKFNTYFLKEIKSENNKLDYISVENNYILFKSGNSFLYNNNIIYYNNIEVCDDVKSLEFKLGKDGDGIDNNIIYVTISFENFNKSINYKVENIY